VEDQEEEESSSSDDDEDEDMDDDDEVILCFQSFDDLAYIKLHFLYLRLGFSSLINICSFLPFSVVLC